MPKQRVAGLNYFDICGLTYAGHDIGTITLAMNDAVEKQLLFWLNWNVVDKFPMCEVPGLDMHARLFEYVRDYPCAFLSSYLPPDGREDLPDILRSFGLPTDHYDMWELAKASNRNCSDYINMYHIVTVDRGITTAVSRKPDYLKPEIYAWCRKNFVDMHFWRPGMGGFS